MFLVGGPAFSGTTLLAYLLNQGNFICLDEPDFHNLKQSHRGIPFLQKCFPERVFPDRPKTFLSYPSAVRLIKKCEEVISPFNLGIKTCDDIFIKYAKIYKKFGYPIIAIVRDIRDSLVRPLPKWLNERKLNKYYRLIWSKREMFTLLICYEDLVTKTEEIMQKISDRLSAEFKVLSNWDPNSVPHMMLKAERHFLLKSGNISKDRLGIWRSSPNEFSSETHKTARLMGYEQVRLI